MCLWCEGYLDGLLVNRSQVRILVRAELLTLIIQNDKFFTVHYLTWYSEWPLEHDTTISGHFLWAEMEILLFIHFYPPK